MQTRYRKLAYLALGEVQLRVIRSSSVKVCVVVLLEFSITTSHGGSKVLVVNLLGDLLSLLNGIHQRSAHNLVLANSDNGRGRFSGHLQDRANCLNTLQGREPAIIGASSTTTLGVSQNSSTGIQTQALCKNVLNGRARDLVELAVLSSLGDNDDCATLASLLAVL